MKQKITFLMSWMVLACFLTSCATYVGPRYKGKRFKKRHRYKRAVIVAPPIHRPWRRTVRPGVVVVVSPEIRQNQYDLVKDRAPHDLKCDSSNIKLDEISQNIWLAKGCDQEQTYRCEQGKNRHDQACVREEK